MRRVCEEKECLQVGAEIWHLWLLKKGGERRACDKYFQVGENISYLLLEGEGRTTQNMFQGWAVGGGFVLSQLHRPLAQPVGALSLCCLFSRGGEKGC